jgi:hypothetical protein
MVDIFNWNVAFNLYFVDYHGFQLQIIDFSYKQYFLTQFVYRNLSLGLATKAKACEGVGQV